MFTTIISTQVLEANLINPDWRILDCRFVLNDPEKAEADYTSAHIPGAVYTNLDRDLSANVRPGVTGRHPLPEISDLVEFFGNCGIEQGTQVVVYDAFGGALAASRAWWLLRWLGFDAVALLDGGWQKWVQDGMPVRGGIETNPACDFKLDLHPELLIDSGQVEELIQTDHFLLLDSRSADRFRGENETIDPVAGHIPGAVPVPYAENLRPDGTFRPAEELRDRFQPILDNIPANQVVFYCGSGVTACHNILSMQLAGLGLSRLYPGSWSEWITDPKRSIAR